MSALNYISHLPPFTGERSRRQLQAEAELERFYSPGYFWDTEPPADRHLDRWEAMAAAVAEPGDDRDAIARAMRGAILEDDLYAFSEDGDTAIEPDHPDSILVKHGLI